MPARKEKSAISRRTFLKGVSGSALAGATAGLLAKPTARAETLAIPGPYPAEKKVRMGIVGGNFGATFQWHEHPNSVVTAVCDLRDDRLERLVKTYGAKKTYKKFHELITDKEVDAVGVFTPAPLHAYMSIAALEAGKHVISAVPAAMSIEECERLIETVKKTGLNYMMAETSCYRPEIITCRQWNQEGKFGTIFYSEAEYHHEGLIKLMFDEKGFPTWRHGYPPMLYPTHSTGMIIWVTGERLTEVTAIGWGDGHEVLQSNLYKNPFWNTVALFKTSGGHAARVAVFWHVAAKGTERGAFYGDRMSYIMARPEGSPNTVVTIGKEGRVVLDENGYPEGDVEQIAYNQPNHWEKLPPPLRHTTGHGGSHSFLTHEFVMSIVEERRPAIDVYEAVAYTAPGFHAHESALRGGECLKIRDFGKAL